MNPPRSITARDNPLLKELRKLGSDSVAYRKLGRIWVEGEHLCSAALARGLHPLIAVFSDAGWERAAPNMRAAAPDTVRLSDALFGSVSALDSPSDMGFVMDLPLAAQVLSGVNTVLLDRVQDAGNVGSILRSASAFGVRQVLALRGTGGWAPSSRAPPTSCCPRSALCAGAGACSGRSASCLCLWLWRPSLWHWHPSLWLCHPGLWLWHPSLWQLHLWQPCSPRAHACCACGCGCRARCLCLPRSRHHAALRRVPL
jgi:hypothetical protein